MSEIWAVAPGFPDYEVSNRGRVRRATRGQSTRPGREIKQRKSNGTHLSVHIYRDGIQYWRFVHRLVIKAFGPPQPTVKHEVNHIDGNPENNRIGNLEWVTRSENLKHAVRLGLRTYDDSLRGEESPVAKLTRRDVIEILQRAGRGETGARIALDYDVCESTIRQAIRGDTWKHIRREDA